MIRSFLNVVLPDDEYKRKQILYFMAEAMFLTVSILLVLGLFSYIFNSFLVDSTLLLFLSPFLMTTYVYFRYILAGMEYTEVFRESDYKKQRRQAILRSLIAGAIFTVALLIVKGIPGHIDEAVDVIMLPIFFIVFYFLFELISLKRSIRKNRDLDG